MAGVGRRGDAIEDAVARIPGFSYSHAMEKVGKSNWRILSKHGAKPLLFAPQLWKAWNSRVFGDHPRMRGQNLVFELHNLPNSRIRKISLVSRLATTLLNRNVSMVIEGHGVDTPEERSPKKTISLALWSAEKGQLPDVPEFKSTEEVEDFLDRWNEMNGGVPMKVIQDINKKIRHNISVRNEIREEF